ncbi:MAG TPA: hypothetical protein VFK10_00655 [Burkholderiaceae bacterium]|nr:hypothetical protein [Burkholderiaceae bacterium]
MPQAHDAQPGQQRTSQSGQFSVPPTHQHVAGDAVILAAAGRKSPPEAISRMGKFNRSDLARARRRARSGASSYVSFSVTLTPVNQSSTDDLRTALLAQ